MRKMLQRSSYNKATPTKRAKTGSRQETDSFPSLFLTVTYNTDSPTVPLQQVNWHCEPHKQQAENSGEQQLVAPWQASACKAFQIRAALPSLGCPEGGSGSGVPATTTPVLQACLQLFFPLFKRSIDVKLHSSFYHLHSWLQAPSGPLKMGPLR